MTNLGPFTVRRVGFGAMQLPGPGVFGPPRDPDAARAVLRRAIELGVDHIDTAQYYGPDVANDLIREALFPYPEGLRLVTKVGGRRDEKGAWLPAQRPDELRAGVEDNLRSLGVERMALVNLRLIGEGGPAEVPLADQLGELEELRGEGKLELIGLSNVGRRHGATGRWSSPISPGSRTPTASSIAPTRTCSSCAPSTTWRSCPSSRSAPRSRAAPPRWPGTRPSRRWPPSTRSRRHRWRSRGCFSATITSS